MNFPLRKKSNASMIIELNSENENKEKYFSDYKQVIILIYLRIFLKFCDNINYFD